LINFQAKADPSTQGHPAEKKPEPKTEPKIGNAYCSIVQRSSILHVTLYAPGAIYLACWTFSHSTQWA